MSSQEVNNFVYIPADERRLRGAQDVYQTAARLRPVLRDIFKTGGLLDELNLADPAVEDKDSLATHQVIAGANIEQVFASRADNGVAYVAAEMGYLRHAPNFSPDVNPSTAVLVGAAREIALASSIYLDLPPATPVTFDPVQIPAPNNLLYLGVIESFNAQADVIQPLKTCEEYGDTAQPFLLWKIDPHPGYWSDAINSPAARQPFHQGDLLISHLAEASQRMAAQTLVFVQSHSEEYCLSALDHFGVQQ